MGTVKSWAPNVNGRFVLGIFIWLFIIIIIVAAIAFALYFWIQRKRFNKIIIVFSKVNGVPEVTFRDKAMETRVGVGGDTCFYLLKAKKFIPRPTIQTGRNIYWFFVKEDGDWINIGLEDVDENLRRASAHFTHVEMRYAKAGLQKNLKDRYNKPTFWQQYGGIIMFTGLVAITGIMIFLLFDKYLAIADKVNAAIEASVRVLEQTERILAVVDRVGSGSGLVSA